MIAGRAESRGVFGDDGGASNRNVWASCRCWAQARLARQAATPMQHQAPPFPPSFIRSLPLTFFLFSPIPSIVCESLLSYFRRTSSRRPVIRSDLPVSTSHTRFLAPPRLTSAFHRRITLIYRLTTQYQLSHHEGLRYCYRPHSERFQRSGFAPAAVRP